MREYVTRAVVLDKATRFDADARYSFFTERYGKIIAKAKSSRKIGSKLAGHLEPGTFAAVRIIEQRGTQVIDALKVARVDLPLADLSFLGHLLLEWEPDEALWRELRARVAVGTPAALSAAVPAAVRFWPRTLAILGWDPEGAPCAACGRGGAGRFFVPRQEFFCAPCAATSRLPKNDLLLIS